MLSKFSYFWRIFHYFVFTFLKLFQKGFNRLSHWYNQLSFIQRQWEKKGIYGKEKIRKQIDFETTNPMSSLISIQAGIHTGGILVILEFALAFVVVALLGENIYNLFFAHIYIFGVLFLIPPALLNYFLLFRGDRYLEDFDDFEALPQRALSRFKILSVFFVVSVPILFFASLLWAVSRYAN